MYQNGYKSQLIEFQCSFEILCANVTGGLGVTISTASKIFQCGIISSDKMAASHEKKKLISRYLQIALNCKVK